MLVIPLTLTLVLAAGEPAAPAKGAPPAKAAAPAKNPDVLGLLNKMCDRIKAAKTFTVRGLVSIELPVGENKLATYFNDYEFSVRRPDGLMAHRWGDMPDLRFVYDGKSMTALDTPAGKWGTTSAPATIDAMLPVADAQGGINMPFDEFLVADPCPAITAAVTEAVMAMPAVIKGKKVEHLVLSGPTIRLEYWIDPATLLPVRAIVVYLDDALRPHFQAEVTEWKLDPKLPASTFALPKPKGATEVDFREATSQFR
jgi:hypothetical protein